MADGRAPAEAAAAGTNRPANEGPDGRRWEGAYEVSAPAGSAVQVREFSVRSLDASEVTVERCAVGRVRGGKVQLRQSGALVALGKDVRLRQAGAAIVAGGRLRLERGGGQWLIGGLVQARQVFAVAVIAARVEGQVRCLFDARSAFALGAGAALMTTVLRFLARRS